MAQDGLTAQPLQQDTGFNWIFLIELLVCGVLSLFFLFYFNRLFATIVSYGVRAYTWHKYRVHVHVQALQISLLAGRIFFKGLRYHGDNETILIQGGNITWRYWLRKSRHVDLTSRHDSRSKNGSSGSRKASEGENGGIKVSEGLPCRLQLSCQGFEWFVYNRAPAYNSLVTAMFGEQFAHDLGGESASAEGTEKKGPSLGNTSDESAASPLEKQLPGNDLSDPQFTGLETSTTESGSPKNRSDLITPPTIGTEDLNSPQSATRTRRGSASLASISDPTKVKPSKELNPEDVAPLYLKILPIHVECTKGAIVLGNISTQSVLIAQFDKAEGEINASRCQTVDPYKQLFNFDFNHPVVQIKPNPDFKGSQSSLALNSQKAPCLPSQDRSRQRLWSRFIQRKRKVLHAVQGRIPYFRSSVETFASFNRGDGRNSQPVPRGSSQTWTGLSRYLNDDPDDRHKGWNSVEYARFSTVLDSPHLSMSFYWDVPGLVPKHTESSRAPPDPHYDLNSGIPPEWALDLRVQGGTINYGPWTDRQREELQNAFFPRFCKDAVPTQKVQGGLPRVYTEFKIFIELEDEVTLRIPTREKSKDWKWTSKSGELSGIKTQEERKQKKKGARNKNGHKGAPAPAVRPFAWLDIKVLPNSTIAYFMDMVAGRTGYRNSLDLELRGAEISTSVNHGLLLTSEVAMMSCDLSNPLKWNALHQWKFDVNCDQLQLYLLREHIFLLSDLVEDWGSGPPTDYFNFTPYRYLLDLQLNDFKLYLNANDSNVINNPSDFEDNTFITIWGSKLMADLVIPLDKYLPDHNTVTFDVKAFTGGLDLLTPPWNTQATFLDSGRLANLEELRVTGQYDYYTSTSVALTDTLTLSLFGRTLSVDLYGFLIRYVLLIKDNYFGDDVHFKTLEEYQAVRNNPNSLEAQESTSQGAHHNKTNDLDVILTVEAENGKIVLPASLYSARENIQFDLSTLKLDMRFTSYYMDLDVAFSPLSASLGRPQEGQQTPTETTSETQLFIDGIKITGHRLFGLPPAEPTYVCNWDLQIGAISGQSSTQFLKILSSGLRNFVFSFDDEENALPPIKASALHDITFLRLKLQTIHIWVLVDQVAFLVKTNGIDLNFNDWAGTKYSERLSLLIPDISLACVDSLAAVRQRFSNGSTAKTHAYVQTSIKLTMIERKLGFRGDRLLQQEHVRRHDVRTHRADFLLRDKEKVLSRIPDESHDPPAMIFPPMPIPLRTPRLPLANEYAGSKASSLTSADDSIIRKSSFLSSSSLDVNDQFISNSAESARKTRKAPTSRPVEKDTVLDTKPFPRTRDEKAGILPDITLTTSFMAPSFSLNAVAPDLSDVPVLPGRKKRTFSDAERFTPFNDISTEDFPEDAVHTSFFVDMDSGIRALCDPKTLRYGIQLLEEMQPKDPIHILDEIQVNAIDKVLNLAKERLWRSKVTDLNLRFSQGRLRFVNSSDEQPSPFHSTTEDLYDVDISGVSATFRSQIEQERNPKLSIEKTSLGHLITEKVDLSMTKRSTGYAQPKTVISGGIDDIVCWFSSGKKTTASVQFHEIDVATKSAQLEHAVTGLERISDLANDLQRRFVPVSESQKKRIQDFIYSLQLHGAEVPDPSFLTRPSYVLRSASDHLRISDSWKIISRLRQMYKSLPATYQESLVITSMSNDGNTPSDAQTRVIEGFDQWRQWDLANVKKSYIMEGIYGSDYAPRSSDLSESRSSSIYVKTRIVKIAIDSGAKQNEIALDCLAMEFKGHGQPVSTTKSPTPTKADGTTGTFEIYAAKALLKVSWELCDTVQSLARKKKKEMPAEVVSDSKPASDSAKQKKQQYHVVFATGSSEIQVETINLSLLSAAKGLKGSVITSWGPVPADSMITVMVNADATTTEISHHSHPLTLSQLRKPSIYFSVEQKTVRDTLTRSWKMAGACKHLIFKIQEDVLGLVEVANTIILDEVAYIVRLMRAFGSEDKTRAPMEPSNPEVNNKLHLALFLDVYEINIALLRSLKYVLAGSVARTSVAPRKQSGLIFDFDVKSHSHEVSLQSGREQRVLSLLQLPPINGRVDFSNGEHERFVEVIMSVESIILDAAALHNLWIVFEEPELERGLKEIISGVETVKGHVTQILPPKVDRPAAELNPSSKQLVYDARITIAGLGIHANAPGLQADADSAHLEFNLGCVQTKALNRLVAGGPILDYPEVSLGLRQISFELLRVVKGNRQACGKILFGAYITSSSKKAASGSLIRTFHISSDSLEIDIFAGTAATLVDVAIHLQNRLKDLDLSREKKYLRRFRRRQLLSKANEKSTEKTQTDNDDPSNLMNAMYSFELLNIQISWIVGRSDPELHGSYAEDLVLVVKRIGLSMSRENAARLTIENFLLHMVPQSQLKTLRSLNSALLPELVFNVAYLSTDNERRLAFQAAGKSLDLRLTSEFVIPANNLQRSIAAASDKLRAASEGWENVPKRSTESNGNLLGNKRLGSLLVDIDFAGATVYLQGKRLANRSNRPNLVAQAGTLPQNGRYGQFLKEDSSSSTTLQAPGVAFKFEYKDNGVDDQTLNGEIKVDASNNILYPSVVPLILEISSSVKEIVSETTKDEADAATTTASQGLLNDDTILTADPSAILGRCKLNVGLRICKQEFGLSCQPIARVAATARADDIYLTVNTIESTDGSQFFAISAAVSRLQVSVQHVYSRESTGSFDVDSIVLSLMNSKHVSGTGGVSAILKISPMKAQINAKQLQDFMLFREIWVPADLRAPEPAVTSPVISEPQGYLVQRYQQVAAASAFTWNAAVSIEEISIHLDLGQSLGKSSFGIADIWMSSKKSSNWEQNLCFGLGKVSINSTGRMSGLVELSSLRIRTSIRWPTQRQKLGETPLIQASLGFGQLLVKASFDYQAFLIADITAFDFLMYNVRNEEPSASDRLVAIVDGGKVQVFCTTASASQALALYQAVQRFIQEKKTAFLGSVKEIERLLQRKASVGAVPRPDLSTPGESDEDAILAPISLQTDVVVTLRQLNLGAFPSTFSDNQVLKLDALDAQARFGVNMERGQIHSGLGLTLGQLRVALSGVPRPTIPKTLAEVSIAEVVSSVTDARGGTILKVPKVVATMQTWQIPASNHIDYKFKSSFEGKVDVGWNYSRISFIRGMWANHSKALAHRLGKPLSQSAVRITGGPQPPASLGDGGEFEDEQAGERRAGEPEKITAVVNVPQSKYDYSALAPPIIETPQLRDMGEATPPLEWIGLHRERLPHVTHQLVIVTLLEVAREVEDAYSKILVSS
ncbi:MAG: hypothetical protein M4579_003536 [Chaenotheca gracillima]|nr:MAG: hypothetical protein M4579_003536 [Chaenotheca gracillima]